MRAQVTVLVAENRQIAFGIEGEEDHDQRVSRTMIRVGTDLLVVYRSALLLLGSPFITRQMCQDVFDCASGKTVPRVIERLGLSAVQERARFIPPNLEDALMLLRTQRITFDQQPILQLLRNGSLTMSAKLELAGIEDPAVTHAHKCREDAALAGYSRVLQLFRSAHMHDHGPECRCEEAMGKLMIASLSRGITDIALLAGISFFMYRILSAELTTNVEELSLFGLSIMRTVPRTLREEFTSRQSCLTDAAAFAQQVLPPTDERSQEMLRDEIDTLDLRWGTLPVNPL